MDRRPPAEGRILTNCWGSYRAGNVVWVGTSLRQASAVLPSKAGRRQLFRGRRLFVAAERLVRSRDPMRLSTL